MGRGKEAGEYFALIEPVLARHGIVLDSGQSSRLQRYAELLHHWNRRINLIGDGERIYSRHLLDCLMLCAAPWPESALEILDVGSGAGLPGMVVAIMQPQRRITSIESVGKKVTFQQVAAADLGLQNFVPLRRDVHELARSEDGQGAYDVVLARAFAGLGNLLQLAGELLVEGGELWAMKGRKLDEEKAALPPELRLRFEAEPSEIRYDAPELGVGGVTAIYRKKIPIATEV